MAHAEAQQQVVVDTDMGCDDAVALMVLLRPQSPVHVVAVTTVAGNTPVQQASKNASVVLHHARRSDIPVYQGCHCPLLEHDPPALWEGRHRRAWGLWAPNVPRGLSPAP